MKTHAVWKPIWHFSDGLSCQSERTAMLLIPAIDLKDGNCVRLRQGLMEDATVFSDQPADMALAAAGREAAAFG